MDLSQRELVFQGSESGFRVILKRNCSISPAALLRIFMATALVLAGIATGFAMLGAWMILPFAGIELAALGLAFLLNGRHAADCERIELEKGWLTVEVTEAERTARHEFAAREVCIGMKRGATLVLSDRERTMEIGRHLAAHARAAFGAELAKRLKS